MKYWKSIKNERNKEIMKEIKRSIEKYLKSIIFKKRKN